MPVTTDEEPARRTSPWPAVRLRRRCADEQIGAVHTTPSRR